MKKIILRILAAVILLLIVAVMVVFFSLNTIVKKGVETVGPVLTKVEVRLGSARISPFSGHGRLSEMFVGNPEGYKTASSIKVGDIHVGVQASSLLSDTIVVNEVHVQAPEITFEGSLSGNNLSKILDNLEGAPGGKSETPAPKTSKKSEKKFQVKDLSMTGGQIHLSVSGLGGRALTVPLPELHLQNIGTSEGGVSAAELTKQVLKPLLASVTKEVEKALSEGVTNMGKGATDEVNKATKGIKDLFKK